MKFLTLTIFILLACSPAFAQESSTRPDANAPLSASEVKQKISQLKDQDRPLEAIDALGKDGTPAAKQALRSALKKEKNPHVRARLVDAIDKKQDKDSASELSTMAKSDADADVRSSAVRALGYLKDAAAVAVLIEKFNDEKEQSGIRLQAANSLANYPRDDVFTVLVEALGDSNVLIRKQALVSLYNGFSSDKARVRPHLERMLKDNDTKELAEKYLSLLGK